MHLGTGEWLMLLIIGAIVFSASRMGALGNAVGKFVYSFKKAAKGDDLIDVTPKQLSGPDKPAKDAVVDAQRK